MVSTWLGECTKEKGLIVVGHVKNLQECAVVYKSVSGLQECAVVYKSVQ